MNEIANRSSWNSSPLPAQREKLSIERTFSEEEYNCLSRGWIPEGMDDKWFIFMEKDILHFHRSWTGFCIYEVYFDDERAIRETWVNRDSEQYTQTNGKNDENLLMILIDRQLTS